jgi:hypothetical protein
MWHIVLGVLSMIYLITAGILAGVLENRKYIFTKCIFWPLMPFVELHHIITHRPDKQKINERKLIVENLVKYKSVDEIADFYNKIGSNNEK